MNLSKATRECKNLQKVMREVMNWERRGGRTQLNYYCYKGMTSSVMRMLEMKSIDVEARQKCGFFGGFTCLRQAARYGHLDICRLLIDKGAHIEAKDSSGWTSLHYAAEKGHLEIARLLCDRGADIEARSNSGRRLLHIAAMCGYISIVKELIEVRNAEINARTDYGETALAFARDGGHSDIVAYLVSLFERSHVLPRFGELIQTLNP
jgi:ankyrin repeat protein